MENLYEYFRKTYDGPVRGDCCSHTIYEAKKPVTVQEVCDYILSNDRIWGWIGIASPNSIFGDPKVEYCCGKYVDGKRNPIKFEFPPKIAKSAVKRIDRDGGWSMEDWVLTI